MGMRSIYASAQEGKDMMEYELTPEKVMEIGKGFEDAFLACLPIEKRLKGLKPEERMAGLKPEDIFARFKPEDILGSLSDKDIMAYIDKKGKGVKAERCYGQCIQSVCTHKTTAEWLTVNSGV